MGFNLHPSTIGSWLRIFIYTVRSLEQHSDEIRGALEQEGLLQDLKNQVREVCEALKLDRTSPPSNSKDAERIECEGKIKRLLNRSQHSREQRLEALENICGLLLAYYLDDDARIIAISTQEAVDYFNLTLAEARIFQALNLRGGYEIGLKIFHPNLNVPSFRTRWHQPGQTIYSIEPKEYQLVHVTNMADIFMDIVSYMIAFFFLRQCLRRRYENFDDFLNDNAYEFSCPPPMKKEALFPRSKNATQIFRQNVPKAIQELPGPTQHYMEYTYRRTKIIVPQNIQREVASVPLRTNGSSIEKVQNFQETELIKRLLRTYPKYKMEGLAQELSLRSKDFFACIAHPQEEKTSVLELFEQYDQAVNALEVVLPSEVDKCLLLAMSASKRLSDEKTNAEQAAESDEHLEPALRAVPLKRAELFEVLSYLTLCPASASTIRGEEGIDEDIYPKYRERARIGPPATNEALRGFMRRLVSPPPMKKPDPLDKKRVIGQPSNAKKV
ncbi:hypothetical protein CVT24_012682 [Panaeolus cyanescens]|uniref:Uncharacterized protein n=1 Tax=Panaeolus cyanescens TaxID=181874 RepID=A0A409YKA5_9AGAR|nr:hypothetical protein CVT24_012682 [Panaeolus cyanescens]